MKDMPTAVVVASHFMYHTVAVQRMLSTNTFRIYASQDIIGKVRCNDDDDDDDASNFIVNTFAN